MNSSNASTEFSALFTDFYSLTMAQGYWKTGMKGKAVFEMFFRKQPFDGGFSVFAGLETLLERLTSFAFTDDDLDYLAGITQNGRAMFDDGFLKYLKDFRFTGTLWAYDEGTVIFPNEPIIRIYGNLIECQIIEGMLLNTINFQSLIATKTARVWLASGKGSLMEFGLRRAQGFDGAMSASRAAYIGGASGTSNVLAGKTFNIPVLGTMAHAWIMAFPDEEAAFHAYADIYPDKAVFLIDTYDTLKSGIHNAIKAGKKLVQKGHNFGVRLDSGDMHYLSVEVRKILDREGFNKATISVSNDLDEHIVQTLKNAGAPIDVWGVGTQMVTGGKEAAFTGVYKLAARDSGGSSLEAVMKFSDNPEKTTNPGVKQVWRIQDEQGMFLADILALDNGDKPELIEQGKTYTFWHPSADYRHFSHTVTGSAKPLLQKKIEQGKLINNAVYPSLDEIKKKVSNELGLMDQSYLRFLNPHIYKVSITEALRELKLELIKSQTRSL